MKVIVDAMPQEPKDCLFSEYHPLGDFYVCTLRQYIAAADEKDTGYKPKCICRDCSKCDNLEVHYE